MFEKCTTIKELNEERIRLLHHVDRAELNAAFESAKKELLSKGIGYETIPKTYLRPVEAEMYNACFYAGNSPVPNKLMITENGVLV